MEDSEEVPLQRDQVAHRIRKLLEMAAFYVVDHISRKVSVLDLSLVTCLTIKFKHKTALRTEQARTMLIWAALNAPGVNARVRMATHPLGRMDQATGAEIAMQTQIVLMIVLEILKNGMAVMAMTCDENVDMMTMTASEVDDATIDDTQNVRKTIDGIMNIALNSDTIHVPLLDTMHRIAKGMETDDGDHGIVPSNVKMAKEEGLTDVGCVTEICTIAWDPLALTSIHAISQSARSIFQYFW